MAAYGSISPVGDEMGLMAYLPFSEMKENESGILEQVFSINDQRVFKTSEGDIVDKVQPLVKGLVDGSDINALEDDAESAPVEDMGQLTKLKFDWAFNNDELMININMRDRQINKQQMYITVRDVEDLNGNPMVSPVTWTAFVDRNALKWEKREITANAIYGSDRTAVMRSIRIINNSGKRHQYTIESLADWLTVDEASGSLNPTEETTVTFSFDPDLAPGAYTDVVYLTDEDGLSEPINFNYEMTAEPPYDGVDKGKYPLNMSVCGQIIEDIAYDTDAGDIVYAFHNNECIGMTNIDFDDATGISSVFITIFGNESIIGKQVNFMLWQEATGKVLSLKTSVDIIFGHGKVYGCGNEEPVIFATVGYETQYISLTPGWNWTSFNLDVEADKSPIKSVMTASDPWQEGDIIKNPATRQFVTYSNDADGFVGMFDAFDYRYIYMIYAQNGNTMRVGGNPLTEDKMVVTFKGDSTWSPLPCMLSEATAITEALADYYDLATPGDLVKSHDQFAVFSKNKHWEGDLKALHPGNGYLFRRVGKGDVTVNFYNQDAAPKAPKRANAKANAFSNPNAATNMTMIATVEGEGLKAYIAGELVGVGTAVDSLYFITIQSDKSGTIEFRTADGTPLQPLTVNNEPLTIGYQADAHHGTLKAPIVLRPGDDRPYKVIENNHVIIIRNNEKYDVTGKKL